MIVINFGFHENHFMKGIHSKLSLIVLKNNLFSQLSLKLTTPPHLSYMP